jgi:putative transcriptional regulator
MRFLLFLAALFEPTAIFSAAQQDPVVPPPTRSSLIGQLLVASPEMPELRYRRTVVVVVQHTAEGGFGIVINRSAGDQPLTSLFEVIGEQKDDAVAGTVPIFSGGPVQPELFFVMHSNEYRLPETASLTADVAMTSSPKIFHDIAQHVGPRKYLIAFGYVGWAPGQLERQIAINAWRTAPLDAESAFEVDRDKLWELAFERRRQDP